MAVPKISLVALYVLAHVAVSAALALPKVLPRLQSVPSHAASLSFDEVHNVTLAYDSTGALIGQVESGPRPGLERRQDGQVFGTCALVTIEELQKLEGYYLIEDYAKVNWGDGWDQVRANPSDWPESGATACIDSISKISWSDQPSCSTQSQTTEGRTVDTTGKVTLSQTQGATMSSTVTVTDQASLAIGAKVSAKVGVPAVAEVTTELSTTLTLQNTLATANQFTINNQLTQSVTIDNLPGAVCKLSFTVDKCDAQGTGTQKLTAHGWVWITYKDKRKDHWNWAVNMDAIITNPDQRSSSMRFNTVSSAESKSHYEAVCEGGQTPASA
ncbi:hypothetical protein BKA62DRAFT_264440 [Auriculariales sp. MPI-PUGE-AT-0066]|nr:hypothetical protein BKA62DRAFT_264440 [Auriculariales sp. MPI-PUGE-AT-0066]